VGTYGRVLIVSTFIPIFSAIDLNLYTVDDLHTSSYPEKQEE
jgi:hypothetical protein